MDTPTDPDLDIDREALAAADAHMRTEEWVRKHPGENPNEIASENLRFARRDAGLPETRP